MSIIPAFGPGLWNVWIFMLLVLIPLPLVAFLRKGTFKKTASIHASVLTKTDNKIFIYLLIGINFADDCLGECCHQPS
jgi:hypothetical protein